MMALPHPRIDRLLAPQGQDRLAPRFALEGTHGAPLDPPLLRVFLHLPIGPPWGPAEDNTRRPAGRLEPRGRGTTSKRCQAGSRLPGGGLGANRRPMPSTATAPGGCAQSPGLRLGPLAHDPAHAPFPLCRHCGVRPPLTRPLCCGGLAPFLLFCTPLPGSSNSSALGVSPGTGWAWHRSAGRPGTPTRRATVSGAPWTRRAVARTRQPAPRWSLPSSACGSGSFVVHNAVPRRAEHSSPPRRQRHRRLPSCPYPFRMTRLRAPGRRNNWHATLTHARGARAGRFMGFSLSTVGRWLKDFLRTRHPLSTPLR